MRWHIDFPDGSDIVDLGDRFISADGPEVQSVVISDSTVLFITRTSELPLTSLLKMNNTIVALNGTRIDCSSTDVMESTVVKIFGNGKTNNNNVT